MRASNRRVVILAACSSAMGLVSSWASASTGAFGTTYNGELTGSSVILSADLNGGQNSANIAPTNGYNENTSSGGFSADPNGVLWTGWGGNQYSGGDGTQLPNSNVGNNASSISKTFSTSGSTYYGVSGTVTPPITATLSIDSAASTANDSVLAGNNAGDYGQVNGVASLNSRDRGSPSAANGVNDSDMFRDFVFTGNNSGNTNIQSTNFIDLALSGLTAGASYKVALYSYDSSSTGNSMNWTATAPMTSGGVDGYFAASPVGNNTFTAPADEQTISFSNGTPAPAVFTETADSHGDLNFYGFGGNGVSGNQSATSAYLDGFQIASATAATPEPTSILTFGIGALGLLGYRRARRV